MDIPNELIMRSIPTDLELMRTIDKTKSKEFNIDFAQVKSHIGKQNPPKIDNLEDTYVKSMKVPM